jgi:hypothetical protein
MDEQNVHQFWGISPAVDLLRVAEAAGALGCSRSQHDAAADSKQRDTSTPIRVLQVSACLPACLLSMVRSSAVLA